MLEITNNVATSNKASEILLDKVLEFDLLVSNGVNEVIVSELEEPFVGKFVHHGEKPRSRKVLA